MNPILISCLLTALMHASLLVAAAWLLILTQRRASAARRSTACRLTMIAASGLFVLTAGSALLQSAPNFQPFMAPVALPQGPGFIVENSLLAPSDDPPNGQPVIGSSALRAKPLPSGPLMLTQGNASWLAATWLTGAALVLLVWLRSLAARLTLLRHSEIAAGVPWLQTAGAIKGWGLVDEVRLVSWEMTPCVWGVRKGILVLPTSAETWSPAKLKLVLAHECAHLLRLDPLWQILSRFFLALFWFHPLAWSLARRSQTADEQAADDAVLRTDCDGPSYAGLLVECARQFSLTPPLQTTTCAMASPTNLTRRVEAVLNPVADRRPANFSGILAWSALLSILTTLSGFAAPEISTTSPQDIAESDSNLPELRDDQASAPLSQSTGPGSGSKLKLSGDTLLAGTDTMTIIGSAKLQDADFTLTAGKIMVKTQQGTHNTPPGETKNLQYLDSALATDSVVLSGKIEGQKISGTADTLEYTKSLPDQKMILTGWPKLEIGDNLIEGLAKDSRIIINPQGRWVFQNCRVREITKPSQSTKIPLPAGAQPQENAGVTEPPAAAADPQPTPKLDENLPEPQSPDPEPSLIPTEIKPAEPEASQESAQSFNWDTIKKKGAEYLRLSQISEFYAFPAFERRGDSFSLQFPRMIIRGKVSSPEIFINNVKYTLYHPVENADEEILISRLDLSCILDPVLRPKYILQGSKRTPTTIVIDPGHGGHDSGANFPEGKESSYTLDTAMRLKRVLEESGIKANLTRTDDRFMSLNERAAYAAEQPDAMLISLHFNSFSNPATQGMETFFPDAEAAGQETPDYFKASIGLATAIHANCLIKLRNVDRGLHSGKFPLLTAQTKTPAILIECGFLSHPEEAAKIATETWRESLAQAIAGGVKNYLSAIQPSNRVPVRGTSPTKQ